MNKIFLLVLVLTPAWAQAAPYVISAAGSRIGFGYEQMGVAMQGSFRSFAGSVDLDDAQPQKSTVDISVQTASISLGSQEADRTAADAEFFDSKVFPRARFVSGQVQTLGNGRYRITGTFTLKNLSRPLTVDAAMQAQGAARLLTGSFALKRLDWGIGTGEWADTSTLGNDVRVNFALRLMPAPSATPIPEPKPPDRLTAANAAAPRAPAGAGLPAPVRRTGPSVPGRTPYGPVP